MNPPGESIYRYYLSNDFNIMWNTMDHIYNEGHLNTLTDRVAWPETYDEEPKVVFR